jgi:GT2 family glycosyltransferase
MIYILLPVHNRLDETRKFLSCLKIQTCRDYHLVLIDDGCIDGTPEYVERETENPTILRGNGNLWWAGSLEKARKHLLERRDVRDDDVVLIANDDVTFDDRFFQHVIAETRENPNALLLARCYDQETGGLMDQGIHVDWKSLAFRPASTPDEINVLSTRGLFMHFGVFRKIGRLHPVLLPHYGSDYEFTHRAFRKGFTLTMAKQAKVYLNKRTTGEREIHYDIGLPSLLRNLFVSKKSDYNRVMWTNFILLACDYRYIPVNLFRIHAGTFGILARWMLISARKFMDHQKTEK